MHIITLQKVNKGETLTLEVPSHIEEIRLRAKIDFDFGQRRLIEIITDPAQEGTFNSGYYLYNLCKVLTDFFKGQGQDVDLNDFIAVDISDLIEPSGDLKESVLRSHVDAYTDADTVNPEEVNPTLIAIFDHINALISTYTFDYSKLDRDLSFTYKGEDYKVFRRKVDSMYGEMYDPVSVGELTEAFEISRQLHKNYGEVNASITLTEMLGVISILARKEGEELPLDEVERFVEARSKHFFDIPYPVAAEVFFYLTPSLNTFLSAKTLNTFSDHLNPLQTESLQTTSENKSQITSEFGIEQDLKAL